MLASMTKVFKCINTSNTLDQLETTRRLMNNFFDLYDIELLNQLEIKLRLETKYTELSEGIYGS